MPGPLFQYVSALSTRFQSTADHFLRRYRTFSDRVLFYREHNSPILAVEIAISEQTQRKVSPTTLENISQLRAYLSPDVAKVGVSY